MRKLVVSEAVTVDGVFGPRENGGTTMKTKVIGYWVTTAILVFVMFSGAVGELTHNWGTLETVTILGYPLYLLTIVAVWKVAGSIALLVPGFPRLKEWASAGIFFNMTGAVVSHAAVGDARRHRGGRNARGGRHDVGAARHRADHRRRRA